MNPVTRISKGPADTMAVAAKFARNLKPGDIVLLKGELGAGKTVFTKGIAKGLRIDPSVVNSPTFVVMNHYEGKLPIYHFDLYRLQKEEELQSVSFDEFFFGTGISVVEWPQHLRSWAPERFWLVEMSHVDEHQRQICISYHLNPQRKISV